MKIERLNLKSKLVEFCQAGSGLIIGKPGVGKSYMLKHLQIELSQREIIVLTVRVDYLAEATDYSIGAQLALGLQWVEVLQDVQINPPYKAILIFDAFDAARDETLRKNVLSQIKKAQDNLVEKWNVIVSCRTYDAEKSSQLQRFFHDKTGKTRKFIIPELTDEEVVNAMATDVRLKSFHEESSFGLKAVLRTPFFLGLLFKIAENASERELSPIKRYKSETELLNKFWETKITKTEDYLSKERLLRLFTNLLVKERSLSCFNQNFFKQFSEKDFKQFEILRSESILEEVSTNGNRIAYVHNILFDFAVSKICITEDIASIENFIKEDLTRPFFLRPSFVYFFSSLWYSNREVFWQCYWQLLNASEKEFQLFVRVILNGIIVSEYETHYDIIPIINHSNPITKIGALKSILLSIRVSRTENSVSDLDLLLYLSTDLNLDYIWEVAYLLYRQVNDSSKQHDMGKYGEAARNLMKYILENRRGQNSQYLDKIGGMFGVGMIMKTYESNIAASRSIVEEVEELIHEPGFEINYFSSLCEDISSIIPFDIELVQKIYYLIFSHTETSQEKTVMGNSSLMNFTSNRMQDFELCKFRLTEVFSQFLQQNSELALQTGLKIINDNVIREKLSYLESVKVNNFKYYETITEFIPDFSLMWEEGYSMHYEKKIMQHIISYISTLVEEGKEGLYEKLVRFFAYSCRVTFTWRALIKLGIKYPKELKDVVYPLILNEYILKDSNTIYEIIKFIEVASSCFSSEQLASIEKFAIRSLSQEKDGKLISRILSQIPEERLQLEESKIFMKSQVRVANMPEFSSTSSSGVYTEEMWLEDRGVDTADPVVVRLLNLREKLEEFNNRWRNHIPSGKDYQEIVVVAYDVFIQVKIQIDVLDKSLSYSLLREVAQTFSIIVKDTRNISTSTNLFEQIKEVIFYCFNYNSQQDIANKNASPSSGYVPTPRNTAAEALAYLATQEFNETNFDTYKQALNDVSAVVRFGPSAHLELLKENGFSLFWQLLIDRLSRENDPFLMSVLLSKVAFESSEKVPEQAQQILDLILKSHEFDSKNSFLEAFVQLVINVIFRYGYSKAKEIILGSYENEALCQNFIFEIFQQIEGALHSPNFQTHSELVQLGVNLSKNILHEIANSREQNRRQDDSPILTEEENRHLQLISYINQRIFFAIKPPGQFAPSKTKVPEKNLRSFYFSIKPVYEDIVTVSANIRKGLMSGTSAHSMIQALNIFFEFDAKDILRIMTIITRYAAKSGYIGDTGAIEELVKFTEKLFADHRYLLQEEESFNNIIELLDLYNSFGWVQAQQLLWKLDEVFR